MSRKLDWAKANKLYGKPYLDYRREFEFKDRAAKWLRRAESKKAAGGLRPGEGAPSDAGDCRSSLASRANWATANSSEVPW